MFIIILFCIIVSVHSQKITLSNNQYFNGNQSERKMNCSIQRWGEYRDFIFDVNEDGKIYVNSLVYNYWCTEENKLLVITVGGNVTVCDKFTVLEENHIGCNYTGKYVSPLETNPNLIILGYRNVCYWDDALNDWNCDSVEANRAHVDCIKNTTDLMWNCVIKYYIKNTFIRYYGPYNNFQVEKPFHEITYQNITQQNITHQNIQNYSKGSVLEYSYILFIFMMGFLL